MKIDRLKREGRDEGSPTEKRGERGAWKGHREQNRPVQLET